MKFRDLVSFFVLGVGIQAFDATQSPGCASACWDNSQYVSTCLQQTDCLCDDANFQNVVLQCLYSQCQTTQFGAALHETLEICSSYDGSVFGFSPPQLIRQKGNRKRQGPGNTNSVQMIHSASVLPYTTHPAISRLTMSLSATGKVSPASTVRPSGFPTGVTTAAINNTFQIQSTNGAARLRIGR